MFFYPVWEIDLPRVWPGVSLLQKSRSVSCRSAQGRLLPLLRWLPQLWPLQSLPPPQLPLLLWLLLLPLLLLLLGFLPG